MTCKPRLGRVIPRTAECIVRGEPTEEGQVWHSLPERTGRPRLWHQYPLLQLVLEGYLPAL
jgi:hypothetical protein